MAKRPFMAFLHCVLAIFMLPTMREWPHSITNHLIIFSLCCLYAENGVVDWFERLDLQQYLKGFVQRVSVHVHQVENAIHVLHDIFLYPPI